MKPRLIENCGDEIILLKCAEGELEAGVVADDEIGDEPGGHSRCYICIAYRGESWLANDHQRLGITIAHAPHLGDDSVDVFLCQFLLDSLEDIHSAGSLTTGRGANGDTRLGAF